MTQNEQDYHTTNLQEAGETLVHNAEHATLSDFVEIAQNVGADNLHIEYSPFGVRLKMVSS